MDDLDDLGARPLRTGSAAAVQQELCRIFYDQYAPRLVAFLIAQGEAKADAEDIVADTMVAMWRWWDRIEKPDRWAYRVASRELLRRRRRNAKHVWREIDPDMLVTGAADEWVYTSDLLGQLAQLPDRQREVMVWTIAGYPDAEIAKELRITEANVRANRMKARRRLADHLDGRSDQL